MFLCGEFMKTAAVVAEYNPFHKGHAYQLDMTRSAGATHIVAVMSGNFVQRGEAAVFDKFLRADIAVKNGADLVVELPLPWAMSGAQCFARGAIGLAGALGCVDMLSFGSECADINKLESVADLLSSQEFENKVSSLVSSSSSFASARQQAVCDIAGEDAASLLETPNSILAIEYISAAKKAGCKFEFNAVTRVGDGYNTKTPTGNGFASASAVRGLIKSGEDYSDYVPQIYQSDYADESKLDTAVLSVLRRMSVEKIAEAPDISEGLENRIYSAIREAVSVEDLLQRIKTKRYPTARLRRIVMSLFLGVNATHSCGLPPYLRVLACNERGREILAASKPTLPIVGRASQLKNLDGRAGEIFSLECAADDIYALCFSPVRECGADFKAKVF